MLILKLRLLQLMELKLKCKFGILQANKDLKLLHKLIIKVQQVLFLSMLLMIARPSIVYKIGLSKLMKASPLTFLRLLLVINRIFHNPKDKFQKLKVKP